MNTERKYLGEMVVGKCPVCDGFVAGMWLDETLMEKDKKETVGDWYLRGLVIQTLQRYSGDPMPAQCPDRAAHR